MSGIELGTPLFIRPSCSFAFGGFWGTLGAVEEDRQLPYQVYFPDDPSPYCFDPSEVLTLEDYLEQLDQPITCEYCGADLTGQFVCVCDNCEDNIILGGND